MLASLNAQYIGQNRLPMVNPGLGSYAWAPAPDIQMPSQNAQLGGLPQPQSSKGGGLFGGLLGPAMSLGMGMMGGGLSGFGDFASNGGIATGILGNNSYSFLPTMSDMPGMTGSTGIDWSGYVYGNGIGGGFTS